MKKGFTLIEIIVVIVLLAVIGTGSTIAVIKVQDKKTEDLLVKNEKKLENALDVYLANHNEVINNINNNSEGAIVSLELLKNEGLITEELGNNKEYFIVSKALLSNSIPTEEDCENGLNIETIASWVKDEDPSKVLYFCPKTYKTKECVTTTGCPACSETCEIKIDDPKDACGKELNENSLACVIFKNIDKIDSNTKFKEPDELNIGESTYESGYYQKIKYSTINKIADNYTSEYGDEYVLNQSGYDKNNANFVGYYLCLTKKDNVEKINSDGKFVFKNKTAISGANLNVTKSSSKNKNQDYINALNIIKNKVNIEDYYLFENT